MARRPSSDDGAAARKDDWCTPPDLWRFGLEVFGVEEFAVDPAAHPKQSVPAINRLYGPHAPEGYGGTDGLAAAWAEYESSLQPGVWVNPPWGAGKTLLWTAKMVREANAGANVCALLPVKAETAWWHDYVGTADLIAFVRARVALVLWTQRREFRLRFRDKATARGWWVIPGRGA